MGQLLKSSSFPEDKRKHFLQVFSRQDKKIIWKWDNVSTESKPENVLLMKWTPQKDLLCKK